MGGLTIMAKRCIPVNDMNQPLGEHHPRARLSDETVLLIRDLYEREDWSMMRIARKLQLSFWTVRRICRYQTRRHVVHRWLTVDVPDERAGDNRPAEES
jgi:AraC-like DNA-binding protein